MLLKLLHAWIIISRGNKWNWYLFHFFWQNESFEEMKRFSDDEKIQKLAGVGHNHLIASINQSRKKINQSNQKNWFDWFFFSDFEMIDLIDWIFFRFGNDWFNWLRFPFRSFFRFQSFFFRFQSCNFSLKYKTPGKRKQLIFDWINQNDWFNWFEKIWKIEMIDLIDLKKIEKLEWLC